MTRRLLAIGMLLALIHGAPVRAQTQESSSAPEQALSAPGCLTQMQDRLAQQQRILRQVWFGRTRASEMPVNSTRFDEGGRAWLKTERNNWRTAAADKKTVIYADADIDRETEWEGMNDSTVAENERAERLGIFAEPEETTSGIVTDLSQSDRAFRCRLAMVCESVQLSFLRRETDAKGLLRIVTPGCDELQTAPLDQCRFGNANGEESLEQRDTVAGFAENVLQNDCEPLADQLATREAAFMLTAVTYDAAQRSMATLMGNTGALARTLRGEVLAPLEQTMQLLSQFSRIPCFAAQCNQ